MKIVLDVPYSGNVKVSEGNVAQGWSVMLGVQELCFTWEINDCFMLILEGPKFSQCSLWC